MNRKLILICTAVVPFCLFFVVAQSVSYQSDVKRVAAKERSQYEWVEKTKKAMAGISVLSAPSRVEDLARHRLGLVALPSESMAKIKFGAAP